ncbi:MAG: recombinase family protein [Christensenella sp.]
MQLQSTSIQAPQQCFVPPLPQGSKKVITIPVAPQEQTRTVTRQLRVAAYCRVSTDQDEQLTSYEAQKQYYTDLIMQKKEWTMAGVLADEGITGTSAKKRPQFLKLIRMCERGKIDVVLTKSISRFARNTVDCLKYVRKLQDLGIAVIFEKENINTLHMEGELLITVLGAFAQAESESISANVSWGKKNSLKNGKVSFQYSRIYGYRKGEDGEPEIIPEQAAVVQKIYQLYLNGLSFGKIKQILEGEGIIGSEKTGEWSLGKIEYILKNEKYCGDALGQKTYITDPISKRVKQNDGQLPKVLVMNNHAPIVSREMFEAVQAERTRRSGKRKVSDKTSMTGQSKYCGKYALSEILICGYCGTPYKRVTWARNGKKKIVWRCINRIDYGTKYCHTSPTIEESKLHAAIASAIQALSLNSDYKLEIIRQNVMDVMNESDDNRSAIENRINEIKNATTDLIQSMTADRIAGNTTDIDYESQFKALTGELQALQDTLTAIAATEAVKPLVSHQLDTMLEALKTAPLTVTEYDDNLTRQLIDTIKVIGENRLLIVFKDGRMTEQEM